MSELTNFSFKGQDVRVLIINNEPWFLGVDVCKILDIKNYSDAYSRLKEYEKTIASTDGVDNPSTVYLSESGLYRLVLTSRKPQAELFQDWVCQEVLPTIRKTGSYTLPTKTVSLQNFEIPTSFPDNLLDAAKMMSKYMNYWVNAEEEKVVLTKQLKSAEQVLDIYRTVLDENACLTFKQFADALNYKGLGRNNLIKFCREVGFLVKRGEAVPRREFIDNGCAIVVTSSYEIQGVQHTTQSTKLTFKGLAWVLNRLRNNGHLITKTARKIWDTYNPIQDETYLVEAKREQLLASSDVS